MNTKRAIIVGDVHGCLDEVHDLLKKVNYDSNKDELVFVGDLVGKGPKSYEIVLTRKGNHDVHVLKIYDRMKSGENVVTKDPTHTDCAKQMTEEDYSWFKSLPYTIELKVLIQVSAINFKEYNVIVVHAGLNPSLPLEQQDTVHMTHMRNIDNGVPLELDTAGVPWASTWKGPQKIIFGHDAVRGIQVYPYAIGLDTGCCYGGELTAIVLPDYQYVTIKAKQMYSKPTKMDDTKQTVSSLGLPLYNTDSQ